MSQEETWREHSDGKSIQWTAFQYLERLCAIAPITIRLSLVVSCSGRMEKTLVRRRRTRKVKPPRTSAAVLFFVDITFVQTTVWLQDNRETKTWISTRLEKESILEQQDQNISKYRLGDLVKSSMISFNFHSLRILALFGHFVATTALFWTSDQSVHVTLKPNYSNSKFESTKSGYQTVISLGIILLSLETLLVYLDQGHLRFKDVFSFGCDVSATFFILWMILDGLGWDTYVYIFSFCV